ncbi:hypothetical protein NDU88_006116 [Pleurodeles waltl]|uniref:Uncharacterized protein n=1 Tax=Pleurodeles waltl TaxID=8319 RepID=A0AAV7PPR6_PLEWA|nr:hypothetical protein NDU88_006116 [Pleurodeles waltl]
MTAAVTDVTCKIRQLRDLESQHLESGLSWPFSPVSPYEGQLGLLLLHIIGPFMLSTIHTTLLYLMTESPVPYNLLETFRQSYYL